LDGGEPEYVGITRVDFSSLEEMELQVSEIVGRG